MLIRQIAFLFSLFLASAATGTLPATASAQSIVVLGINSIEGDDAIARDLTSRMRQTFAAQGCSVSDSEASLAQMQLAYNCSTINIECLNQISTALETGSLVFGTTHRVLTDTEEEIEVELHYFDRLERRIISHHTARLSLTSSPEAIQTVVDVAVPALVRCVRPDVVAPIPVDEDEAGPPDHPIDLDTSSDPDPLTSSSSAPSSYNHEWAGWSLIGLGAALILADIPVWARINDLNNDPSLIDYRHRLAFGSGGDACTNAAAGNTLPVDGLDPAMASTQVGHVRNLCSEGATLEVLQYVFLALGIASAGAGSALLASGVLVSPSVSTDHATLTISGSF